MALFLKRTLQIAALLLGLTTSLQAADPPPADTIFGFSRIWTGNPDQPWAEARAVREGRIQAVGTRAEMDAYKGPATQVIERPQDFALPGLIDAHGHMTGLGSGLEQIDLRGVASLEGVTDAVRDRLAGSPPERWILGQSWDQSLWPGGAFPTAAVLDRVAPDRPVWLTRVDGHAGWANSEAMRCAGVTRETQPPSDGQIIRDELGQPTGVFIDGAMGLIARAIPEPTREDLERYLLAAQEQVLQSGLTGVHDAGVSPLEADLYRALDADGRLKVRIYGLASPPGGAEAAFVAHQKPEPHQPGRHFEMRAIKLYIDGAMGSRGALLFEPYADDPTNRGLQLIASDNLTRTTTAALQNGWQVCTHAIGDRGNSLVLDSYAAAQAAVPTANDARLRIEHAQVVRRQDVSRFRELGVIASMQPAHVGTDQRWADIRLGEERAAGAYAWRWFVDEDVPLAFGSDFPVEITRPYWGLFAALTRQSAPGMPPEGWRPEHKLDLQRALAAHTAGAAYAGFAEDRLGRLQPGYMADITALDRDLFEVDPAEVLEAVPTLTVVDGEIVYQRKN